MPTAHHRKDCPGQCGRRIIHAVVACGPCQTELPTDLREELAVTAAARSLDPTDPAAINLHRHAVTAALAWYRGNTTQAATGDSRGETL
jgi:hypothetical protein